ncbi:unnamed protein product [Lactuca virosa]|uniref:Uncharacterized protein n=1 Tax=Lactuca virosa TaxID=75947 RepID=A0AAU9M0Q6_9ASTR|nr:unnamed protein product [Lactuca virosa]
MTAMLIDLPQTRVMVVDSLQNEDDDCCDPPQTKTTVALVIGPPQTTAMVFDPLQTKVAMVVNPPHMVVAKNLVMVIGQVLKGWLQWLWTVMEKSFNEMDILLADWTSYR